MAFPVITDSAQTHSSIYFSTVHTVDLPDTVYEGDLLLLFVTYYDADDDYTVHPVSGGFTNISFTEGYTGSSLYAKIADGDEGGTTVTVTTSLSYSSGISAVALSISGVNGGIVEDTDLNFTVNNDYGSTSNYSGVTADWGSDDNLFIVFDGRNSYDGDLGSCSAYASGYTLSQLDGKVTSGEFRCGSTLCAKNSASDTDDPGSMTFTVTTGHPGFVAVVRPGSSGGAGGDPTFTVQVYDGTTLQDATVQVYDGTTLQDADFSIQLT